MSLSSTLVSTETESSEKTGVLLVNVGTPDATSFSALRRYLAEFLKDPRIIEWPKYIWYPILYGIILNSRPQKSAKNYRNIWNKEKNESILRTYTRSQSEKLAALCQKDEQTKDKLIIDWAMRYGQPSIAQVTAKMIAQKCTRIILLPLYPQYCAATTASVYDAFFDFLKTQRLIPAIRTISSYAENPLYIETLAQSLKSYLAKLSFKPQYILASYHGIPKSYVEKGDPYLQECQKTFSALKEKLNHSGIKWDMTFQSRFGPEEWLKPYTMDKVKELAQQGVKSLAIFNPGFASDCLETVEEIGCEIAEIFYAHGGENFAHIPCLNDSDAAITLYHSLIKKEL